MAAEREPDRPRRELWPLGLAAALAAMIGASLTMFAISVRYPDPTVVEDAWQAGNRYNSARAVERSAAAAGLALELELSTEPEGVAVRLRVKGLGEDETAQRAWVRRVRPTEGGFDDDFALSEAGGVFEGDVPLPLPGRWLLIAGAEVGTDRIERRFEHWHGPENGS